VTWQLQIDFAENYPVTVPSIRFVTPIFHPNGTWAAKQLLPMDAT
jgi:ubiquitin-protein ligase